MFTFSSLKDAGAAGEWSRDRLYSPESEVGGFKNWLQVCTLRPGENGAEELEKTLFNKGLF